MLGLRPLSKKCLHSKIWTRSKYDIVDNHWIDELTVYVQQKKLLVKRWMMSPHKIECKIPWDKSKKVVPFTFSNLAGHGSFLLLMCQYLTDDFLYLRVFALSGISLSIAFQYYREKPLWIPIRWNKLFLLINGIWIMLLVKEQRDAADVLNNEIEIFRSIFDSKGMTPVDFKRLMSMAKKIEYKKGDRLVKESQTNTRVCLVKSGKLRVSRKGEVVGTIGEFQFVGAMSFLTWSAKQKKEQDMTITDHVSLASHAVKTGLEHISLYELFRKSQETMDHSIDNSILVENLKNTTVQQRVSDVFSDPDQHNTTTTHHIESIDHNSTSNYNNDNNINNTNSSSINNSDNNTNSNTSGQSGYADVVCIEDCVVYSWDFIELRKLLHKYPTLGSVLEQCISEDMNRKLSSSYQEEPKHRYKQLLTGMLMDDEITPKKRQLILKLQRECFISPTEHQEIIQQLGWNEKDYEVGTKGSTTTAIMDNNSNDGSVVKNNNATLMLNNIGNNRNDNEVNANNARLVDRLLVKRAYDYFINNYYNNSNRHSSSNNHGDNTNNTMLAANNRRIGDD